MELCLEEFLNSDTLPTAKTLSKEIGLDSHNFVEEQVEDEREDIETIVAQQVLYVVLNFFFNYFRDSFKIVRLISDPKTLLNGCIAYLKIYIDKNSSEFPRFIKI